MHVYDGNDVPINDFYRRQYSQPTGRNSPFVRPRRANFWTRAVVLGLLTAGGFFLWSFAENNNHLTSSLKRTLASAFTPTAAQPQLLAKGMQDADQLEKEKRYAEALALWSRLVKEAPGNKDLKNRYGQSLVHNGRYADAVTQLEAVIRDGGASAYGWHNLAHAYCEVGRCSEALSAFEQAVRMEPNDYHHYKCGALFIAATACKDPSYVQALPLAKQWYETAVRLGGPSGELEEIRSLLERHIREGRLKASRQEKGSRPAGTRL